MIPILHGMWPWLKEWLTYILPSIVNLLLVLAGILLSFQKLITYIEDHSTLRWVCTVSFIGLGLVGFGYEVAGRHQNEKASRELMGKVQAELVKTDTLLEKIGDVKTDVSLMPALDAKIGRIESQMSLAKKRQDTIEVSKLQKQLDDAKAAKAVLLKQVISNAWLVVAQLRESVRSWNSEEAHAKDEKERARVHLAWNQRGLPLANARAVTLQLLTLLPGMSPSDQLKEIQLQEMKLNGQAMGGTGPEGIQGDADYLEALIKRVLAANPQLAK